MRLDATTPSLMRRVSALLALYGLATIIGGVLLIIFLYVTSIVFGPGVLFYRGVGALLGVFLVLIVLLATVLPRLPDPALLQQADAAGAAIVAASLLFAAFVLGPVTVDRSVSVFLLSQFATAERPLTAEETRDGFVRAYVGDWAQIDRRIKEQWLSGNIEPTAGGWRLTRQGHVVIMLARGMSALFGGDPRFVGRQDEISHRSRREALSSSATGDPTR